MILERIWVFDGKHLLVFIGDQYRLLSVGDAFFFCAARMLGFTILAPHAVSLTQAFQL